MGKYLLLFLAALFLIAIFLREDFVFTLIYLVLGTYILSRGWGQRAAGQVAVQRTAPARLFLGEQAQVNLKIENRSWLPLPWLQIHESLPPELGAQANIQQVVSLAGGGKTEISYWLNARRRGYYPVGPLSLYSGDLFGVVDQRRRDFKADHLVIYPKIVPLSRVALPSQSPLGTLRHTQPLFEDPSRVTGKRDYLPGDSLRRIDWKTSASSGRLQVKKYEPSIALDTELFLNLHIPDYDARHRYDDSELAVTVAASLANWVVNQRQSVGLATNGADSLSEDGLSMPIPPRGGRGHLMRVLEVLARVEAGETTPLAELLWRQRPYLPWGTTQIVITPGVPDEVFDALFQSRQAGLGSLIVLAGAAAGYQAIREKASFFGFPLVSIEKERDLDIWRR